MKYHLFTKTVVGKNGEKKKRYYYWFDDGGIQRQRICKDCKTKKEASDYVLRLNLNPNSNVSEIPLRVIASDMYVPGSEHLKRREQLGKKISQETITNKNYFVRKIIEAFGDWPLSKLTTKNIGDYLFSLNRPTSWKKRFTAILKEVFEEANWHGVKVSCPLLPAFVGKSRKKDVLSPDELKKLFKKENFENGGVDSETFYLFFLCCLYGGLRLGEARALRPQQFLFEKKALVIDGFCKQNGKRTNFNKTGSVLDTKTRIVMLPAALLERIKTYMDTKNIKSDDFMFQKDGKPLQTFFAERVLMKALKRAGINTDGRKLTPHSLRYTYVTLMRRSLPGDVVRQLVGHSDISMTDYYTEFSIDDGLQNIAGSDVAVEHLF